MTKPKLPGQGSFAERFEHLDGEVPMTDGEAQVVLKEAGLDAAESLQRLVGELDAIDAKQRQERFAKAETARRRDLAGLEKGYQHLGHAELLQQLDMYRSTYPELAAQFRNFQGASDDDLRSLLAEVEELIRRASEK